MVNKNRKVKNELAASRGEKQIKSGGERGAANGTAGDHATGKGGSGTFSAKEYRRLTRREEPLTLFLQNSPWHDVELALERSDDTGRDVDL
jgi:hypothetical protein